MVIAWICSFCRIKVDGDNTCPRCHCDRKGKFQLITFSGIVDKFIQENSEVTEWQLRFTEMIAKAYGRNR